MPQWIDIWVKVQPPNLEHEVRLTVDGHALYGTPLWRFLGGHHMDLTGAGGGLNQRLVGSHNLGCLVVRTFDVHYQYIRLYC